MSEAVTTGGGSAEISNRVFSETCNPVDSVVTVSAAQLLVWALVATVTMLFAGFASAYLVRREGLDWVRVRLPGILWVNTGVLLASSATIEFVRRAYRHGDVEAVKRWVQSAVTLGAVFLLGQRNSLRKGSIFRQIRIAHSSTC
jgi:heme/copper-type cytochrome/quinol oxidase subunit 3